MDFTETEEGEEKKKEMKTTVAKLEGFRAPGAEGWQKTWIGITFADGTLYSGVFDDGMDFVPETNRITAEAFEQGRKVAISLNGWTEKMTAAEIKAICNAEVGQEVDAFPAPSPFPCVLF